MMFNLIKEIDMFSKAEVVILNRSLDALEAVNRRRINAEKNEEIRKLMIKDLEEVLAIRSIVNNPKAVTK